MLMLFPLQVKDVKKTIKQLEADWELNNIEFLVEFTYSWAILDFDRFKNNSNFIEKYKKAAELSNQFISNHPYEELKKYHSHTQRTRFETCVGKLKQLKKKFYKIGIYVELP